MILIIEKYHNILFPFNFHIKVAAEIRDYLVKYDPVDPWPSNELLTARVENFMQTEYLIASAKQTDVSLEQSVYQISLVELKNLSKGVHVRDTVRKRKFSIRVNQDFTVILHISIQCIACVFHIIDEANYRCSSRKPTRFCRNHPRGHQRTNRF